MLGCVDIYQIKLLQKINLSIVTYQVTRNQVHFKCMNLNCRVKKQQNPTTTHPTHTGPMKNPKHE